jgi:hypothetical protein
MPSKKTHAANPSETLEAFILACLEHGGPRVELAEFGGTDADWRKDGDAVYLRLSVHSSHDNDGEPHELWARLFAPGGLWHIPRVRTEVMVLIPPHVEVAGVGWCLAHAQTPPAKLDRDKSFLDLPDAVKLLVKAGGWAIRAALGKTIIGVDRVTGEFSVMINGKSFVKFTPAGPAGLPAFEVAIVDNDGKVRTGFKLDAEKGLTFMTTNALGTTKQIWQATPDGAFVALGTGSATFGWKSGQLGAAPLPISIGLSGGGGSTTWCVSPV